MRVCVATHLFPVRSETFVREHIFGLSRRGIDVSVVATGCGRGIEPDELDDFAAHKIPLIYTGPIDTRFGNARAIANFIYKYPRRFTEIVTPKPWHRRELLNASRIGEKIASTKSDVLHVHFGTLAARLNSLYRDTRFLPPMITTWHGYDANIIPRVRGKGIYRNFLGKSGFHTIGSRYMWKRMLELGAEEHQLNLVPMGIDLEKFAYVRRNRPANAPLKILSVGRLSEVKGHAQLIEAVNKLIQKGVSVDLTIVGEGELRPVLKELVQRYSIQDRVTLLGAIPSVQVVAEMYKADIFALTGIETNGGRVEAQGIVYAEAQATGLPVIASAIGGVPDSLLNGQTGVLCQPGDISAIALAIERFIQNPNLLDVYGQNGRRFIEENFSLSQMGAEFEALYEKSLCLQVAASAK